MSSTEARLPFLFATLSMASVASAQQFLPAAERGLYPSAPSAFTKAVFADSNGNGRPDVFVQSSGVLLNLATGPVLFEAVPFFENTTAFAASASIAVDFHGDGNVDIAWSRCRGSVTRHDTVYGTRELRFLPSESFGDSGRGLTGFRRTGATGTICAGRRFAITLSYRTRIRRP